MNLIILKPGDFTGERRVMLSDYRHRHIAGILKAAPAKELRVGVINGMMGTGHVIECDRATVLEVDLDTPPPEPAGIKLILALPRPKVLKRVVSSSVTMGVKEFHIINSWRVDKGYWYSDAVNEGYLDSSVIEALEQSRDTVLPEISFHRFFSKFMDESLPGLSEGTEAVLAHPGEGRDKSEKRVKPVTLAIGPEGGFIEREVDRFISMGFKAVGMGERILRVETAVTAMLARLA